MTREATTLRRPRPWLLIGPPVVLLLIKGAAVVAQLAVSGERLDRGELVVQVVLAALSFLAAVALVAGRRFGWLLAVWIVGWDLAASLVLWWIGTPSYLELALLTVSAALITSTEMRRTFGRSVT
ncbi:MAG: hypothetical protein ABI534_05690 [Chloroflexota bacterium]